MENVEQLIFYVMDQSIKAYRQFAQRQFVAAGYDITVDQWLVLNAIADHEGISQLAIAERVFKDAASVTRIIDLLIKKELLQREAHPDDRRRFALRLTRDGRNLLRSIAKVAEQNRKTALRGIEEKEMVEVKATLQKIVANCK